MSKKKKTHKPTLTWQMNNCSLFWVGEKNNFFLFLRCNNYWKWLKLLTTCRLIYICAAALFLFFIWTTNVNFVCGRDGSFLFYSCQREKFISFLFKYTLHEVYLFINGGKVYIHSFFFHKIKKNLTYKKASGKHYYWRVPALDGV